MNALARKLDQNAGAAAVTFTKISDIDLYRQDADGNAITAVKSDRHWQAQVNSLTRSFPDIDQTTLVLAVVSAYLCRISEDREITFNLVNSILPAQVDFGFAVQIHIEGRESFPAFVDRMAIQQTNSLVEAASRTSFNREQTDHLVVSTGSFPKTGIQADFHLHVYPDGAIEIRTGSHIQPEYCDVVMKRLTTLARCVANDRFRPIVYHDIMAPHERDIVVNSWNDTEVNYHYDNGLVGMFERSVTRNPDHPALIFKDETVSFAEFNSRVNRLAHMLIDAGVGKDEFVCILMDRSIEMVVSIWATIKAGGAYVPLNTEDPQSRILEIIDDCQPKAVLTQKHLTGKLPASIGATVLDEGAKGLSDWREDDPQVKPDPDALAYMIYTSGSTGKPKGVTVEHLAIHNRVVWMHEEYGLLAEDRILQKTPYTFDVSVWEFFWSFAVGSTLVVAEPGGHVAMRYLYQLMAEHNVTHLHFVPSVMRLFLMLPELDKLPIKKLFCSGEALGFDSVETFYEKANPYAEVHNLYGPTEAAVDVSYYHCKRNPVDRTIPIGKPVSNTGLYILDEHDQPVPIGVPGELHIGGVQLARGYWARPELTSERFAVVQTADIRHKRLYNTGDLAYFRRDGEIVYLGRNDFQVKVNGVRMELGEIEAVIRTHPATEDVVVVAEEIAGNKNLIAYVVSTEPGKETDEALKVLVGDSRPSYYVPREVRFLKEMPLTVSGKINRKLLADAPRA